MLNIRAISSGLTLGDNGIWYSKNTEKISYPSNGNDACFAIEENSFWFKHRNNCIVSVVNSYPPNNSGTIFDIGGGNGYVSSGLVDSGFEVALVEPGISGSVKAKNRGIKHVICATTKAAKFKPHSLPAVGLFDVIEHIEDDLSFLRSINGMLEKKGYLYVTVPAYSFLWSEEDVSAGHYRRYTLKSISEILELAGFQIEFSTYIFRFLPIPILLLRALPYTIGFSTRGGSDSISRDHSVKNRFSEKVFNALLTLELKNVNAKKSMSFGGSCLIVARSSREDVACQ